VMGKSQIKSRIFHKNENVNRFSIKKSRQHYLTHYIILYILFFNTWFLVPRKVHILNDPLNSFAGLTIMTIRHNI